ncbi:hypothetical protein TRICI_006266 [Trichomonascus ciferrii]|uniref:C2H2-type domain-containing protein n=1 Tax=Trichomonascus ciferrii TaxID=44093 RepID=A0A642UQM3_9ASCO|nr:hypothetical protein TRICI_006266 [Trichomonascus ciferrii]
MAEFDAALGLLSLRWQYDPKPPRGKDEHNNVWIMNENDDTPNKWWYEPSIMKRPSQNDLRATKKKRKTSTSSVESADSPVTTTDHSRNTSLDEPPDHHNRTSPKKKPYECESCGRAFSRREHLFRHIETTHYNQKGKYRQFAPKSAIGQYCC